MAHKTLVVILIMYSMYHSGTVKNRRITERYQEQNNNPNGMYSESYLSGESESIYGI